MSFLLIIFFLFFLVIAFIVSFFKSILSFIFGGLFKGARQATGGYQRNGSQGTGASPTEVAEEKIFSKDEGEYVSFEEVKE